MRRKATPKPPQAPSDPPLGGQAVRAAPRTSRQPGAHLQRQMRGRYRWLALSVLVGIAIGSALGTICTEPLFRTVALVEVTLPPGINRPPHKSFEERQLALMLDHSVATRALDSPQWLNIDAHLRPANAAALSRRIEAQRLAGEPMQILVTHTHPDARVARIAAHSVVESFEKVTAERHLADRLQQVKRIRKKLGTLRQQLDTIQSRISQATRELGPIPIAKVYASKAAESQHLESLLQSTRMALETIQADADLGPDASAQILARLARADESLGKWLRRHQQVERKLAKLRQHMGRNAPAVVDARNDLRWINSQIHHNVGAAATEPPKPSRNEPIDSGATVTLSVQDLQRRESRLRRRYEQSRVRIAELEDVKMKIEALDKLAATHRTEIDREQSRLERSRTASAVIPHINVLSYGEPQPPNAPYRDRRSIMAALFGVTGGTVGLCLVLLVAALDDRMLQPDSATLDGTAAPLLGAVPGVSPQGANPQESDLAALCIHEIRALLQVRAASNGSKAFAITSPSRGAGTTSLTAGLASSLAISGTRTLLIDCDLAGRVQATPPGAGHRDDHHAEDDMGRGKPIQTVAASVDQVMLQMGYVNEQDASIFLNPRDTETGLLGVLSGSPLEQCVVQTNLPDLWILPALCARAQDIGKMSSGFIRGLIDQAKSMYDIILLDTGPIPGSVEALFVTSAADAVVMVVRRGESQSRFDRSISYLRMVDAEVAGSVFNSAEKQSLNVQAARRADGTQPDAPVPRPRRRPELTAGSGILLAAVQDQSDPIGGTRTVQQAVEQDLAKRAAAAEPQDNAPTDNVGGIDPNSFAPRHGSQLAETPPNDPAEQELDEQIRRLLADASDEQDATADLKTNDRSSSETVGQ